MCPSVRREVSQGQYIRLAFVRLYLHLKMSTARRIFWAVFVIVVAYFLTVGHVHHRNDGLETSNVDRDKVQKTQRPTEDYMYVLGDNESLDPWRLEGKNASPQADLYPWKLDYDHDRISGMIRTLESQCPIGPNYYEVLGVRPGANILEIQNAYNRVKETSNHYQDIKSAYIVLSVPAFRCSYDHKCGIRRGRWHGLQKAVSE